VPSDTDELPRPEDNVEEGGVAEESVTIFPKLPSAYLLEAVSQILYTAVAVLNQGDDEERIMWMHSAKVCEFVAKSLLRDPTTSTAHAFLIAQLLKLCKPRRRKVRHYAKIIKNK
jgi:hypothetical protein